MNICLVQKLANHRNISTTQRYFNYDEQNALQRRRKREGVGKRLYIENRKFLDKIIKKIIGYIVILKIIG